MGGFGLESFGFVPHWLPGIHINPGAIGCGVSGLANYEMIGVGQLETGKVQANMVTRSFPLLFRLGVELDFHNKVFKIARVARWDLRSYAATAP